MRPALLAVLLAAAAAGARAADGAYLSLVGMAESAAADRGPDPGTPPDAGGRRDPETAGAPKPERAVPAPDAIAAEELKDAPADVPARRACAPEARRAPDAGSAVPAAAPAPRAWTRLFAKLTPSGRVVLSFSGPAVSTGTARAPRAAPAPSRAPAAPDPGVKAGERRGLAELLSSAAAPANP